MACPGHATMASPGTPGSTRLCASIDVWQGLMRKVSAAGRGAVGAGRRRPAVESGTRRDWSCLVAVGAMTTATARAVIDEYYQALAPGADDHVMTRRADRPVASAPPGIGQLRVVPCGRVIDQPWGQLGIDCVASSDRTTNLRATVRPAQSPGHPCGQPVPAAGAAAKGHRRPRDGGDRGVFWQFAAC